MSERPARVVMVCTGNICRSPAMHYWARRAWGAAAEVSSAGTYAEIGMDVPSPTRRAAARHDLDIPRHRPTQLDRGILARADLVLVATQQHLRWIDAECSGVPDHVFGIKEAAELARTADAPAGSTPAARLTAAAAALHSERLTNPAPVRSLDDPWARDQATFDRVMDEIVDDLSALSQWASVDWLHRP